MPGHRDRLAVQAEARLLDGDAARSGAPERAADQREALREPGADEHPVGRGRDAADAPEVAAQRPPQRARAARARIRQLRVGQLRQRGAVVAQPLGAREQGRVGQPAEHPDRRRAGAGRLARAREVALRVVARPRGARPRPLLRDVEPHARARSLARLDVAVRGEVGVRVDDDAARDPELRGEHALGGRSVPAASRRPWIAARRPCSSRSRRPPPASARRSTSRSLGNPSGRRLACSTVKGLDVDTDRCRAHPGRRMAHHDFQTRVIVRGEARPMTYTRAFSHRERWKKRMSIRG